MKKLFMLLASVCLSVSAFAQTTCTANCVVSATWAWPASYTPLPACSSATPALKANCGVGWTSQHTAGSSTVVTDSTSIPWTTLAVTVPIPANNSAPTWNFTVFASYLDATGTAKTNSPTTCGSSNTPPPCSISNIPNTVPAPVNFTVTIIPAAGQ